MLSRRNLLSGAAAAAAALATPEKSAAFLPPPSAANHLVTWSRVVINGGGTLPGFSFANDGTILCRTDISGAYKWDGSKWNQIVDENHLPYPAFGGYREIYGVPDIQIAPSDSSRIYVLIQDGYANNQTSAGGAFIYKSTNGGVSFSRTNYPMNSAVVSSEAVFGGANDLYKRIQNKIAVDPANPDVGYAANPLGAPLLTRDGWQTYSNVPDLPSGAKIGAVCWQFDLGQGTTVVNGITVTKYVYVAVEGSGVWRSTDGGVSFSQLATFPSASSLPQYCSMSGDGVYYITYCGAPTAYDFYLGTYNNNTSTWTPNRLYIANTQTARGASALNIAAHPTTAGVVVGFRSSNQSPHFYWSGDYGANWTTYSKTAETFSTTDATWLVNQTSNYNMGNGGMCVFNPASPNDLWYCLGQGLFKATITGSPPAAPSWTTITTGIENAVCDDLIHESGTPLVQVMADIIGFVRPTNSLSTAPTNSINPGVVGGYGPAPGGNCSGWAGAIDLFNTNYMVLAGNQNYLPRGPNFCGYSQDGGASWTKFPSNPGDGTIAAVIPGNIIISNGVILWMAYLGWYRSTDWGSTWTPVGVPAGLNIPTIGDTGWGGSYGSVPSHTGCVDTVNKNKFYIHNNLYRVGPTPPICKGTYVSTDGGQNFAYQGTNSDPFGRSTGIVLNSMKCVPGQEGYLFAATSYISTGGTPHPQGQAKFMKSTDGGATWTQVPNILEVAFGFGKAGTTGNPTLFASGFYKGNYGVYMSEDLGVSWKQFISSAYGIWPYTNDAVQVVEGDKDAFGRCYVGFRGSGTVYSTLVS